MKILVWSFVAIALLTGAWLGLTSRFDGGPVCWGCSTKGHHHCRDERPASSCLKTIAAAQADFRGNDRDGNRVQDFWRGDICGLYSLLPAGDREMIKLIELSVAGADDASLGRGTIGDLGPGQVAQDQFTVFAPKAGYFFRSLRHADEDPDALDARARFAACAYPASYSKATRYTFIVDENNTIFRRDLGRPGPPDVFPDEATLRREWSKVD